MIKTHTILLSLLLFLPFTQAKNPSHKKDAFLYEYPQFYKFRGEMNRKTHQNYDVWIDDLRPASGVIRKFVSEELKINPDVTIWVNQFNKTYPEKLLLLHLNGEARQINDFPKVSSCYFPGHWVYEPGGMLLDNCNLQQTTIRVENIQLFKEKKYANRNKNPIEWISTYVILVKLDKQGNRLWYESEIVHVKKIDFQTGTLTVERGKSNSRPRSFTAGETYVAPIAGGIWGGDVMFYYNLSSACPKDKNGKTAADIFIDEIASWFSPKGALKSLDGIAFDVNYFSVTKNPDWDVNNDGTADGGIVNGKNIWREGDWQFLKSLRNKMGKDFIITGDGQHAENQQAVGILNGIESEGLVQHNDAWRGISRTINTHEYWRKFNNRTNKFNYVVLKFMDSNDASNIERLSRFAVATASALEAYTTFPSNFDFLPSWIKPKSFGKAQGDLIRIAKYYPALLSGDIQSIGKNFLQAHDCDIEYTPEGIILSPKTKEQTSLSFEFKNLNLPSGDLTFFLDSKSLEPLDGFKPEDKVPRIISASFCNLPHYGESNRVNEFYKNLYGMTGTKDFFENSFYYRRQGIKASSESIRFQIDGKGKLLIRSFQVYNKPDILVKEFEHAFVCINPAFEKQVINLAKIFPNAFWADKNIEINGVDALFIKK